MVNQTVEPNRIQVKIGKQPNRHNMDGILFWMVWMLQFVGILINALAYP